MKLTRIVAILLIVAGSLALAYGGFTYTKETHTAKLGPIELNVEEKERVNVPVWAGLGAIAAGVIMLLARRK
jgi:TRAP-type C4-dicarboxylate transport system permease small subunit